MRKVFKKKKQNEVKNNIFDKIFEGLETVKQENVWNCSNMGDTTYYDGIYKGLEIAEQTVKNLITKEIRDNGLKGVVYDNGKK